MKTLKELRERGLNYLIGYTDALADFAQQLTVNIDMYDTYQNQEILKFLHMYINQLFQEDINEKT